MPKLQRATLLKQLALGLFSTSCALIASVLFAQSAVYASSNNYFYAQGRKIYFTHAVSHEHDEERDLSTPPKVPVFFNPSTDSTASGNLTSYFVLRYRGDTLPPAITQDALEVVEIPFSDGAYRIKMASPSAALSRANWLYENKDSLNIEWAHPDWEIAVESRSTDAPYFGLQWNLENTGQTGGTPGADIRMRAAWEQSRASHQVLVAVIDLGFEQNHPALKDAWFVNTGEIPGNKIDDDSNGYKDDVSGWNFATNGNNLLYGAANKHGTATAGIISARFNGLDNRGTAGICAQCTLLPLVVDNVPSNAAAAFYYAEAYGAAVISNSWGYTLNAPVTDVVVDAISRVANNGRSGKGTSIVFAMSNFARNDCRPGNPDISSIPAVVAVSGTDHRDIKTANSAFGPCLKIVAPTSDSTANAIVTTDRIGTNGYNDGTSTTNLPDLDFTNTFWGTSAAAPQVAGVMGLLYAERPDATRTEVLTAILNGADKINPDQAAYDSNGHSQTYGYGRLNALKSLENFRAKGSQRD